MNHSAKPSEGLGEQVKTAWHEFLDCFEPLRPELYRYCRHLTRSPWDAEDLAQDVLVRAFATLGTLFRELPNARAWLFRVASNLWIDRMRHARQELARRDELELEREAMAPSFSELQRATREAAATLLVHLAPRERAALVLKDVFEFSLEEIAEMLSTSPGAVKAALHRARGRIAAVRVNASSTQASAPPTREPKPGALEAFSAAFNARDLETLTTLLREGATVEIVGVVTEYGRDAPKDPYTGSFAGTLAPISFDERGGVPPEYLVGYAGGVPRCEVRAYHEEWILLFWYNHTDGESVRTIMKAELADDGIARMRNYFFTPHVIAEVCSELSVPYRVNGYSFWRPPI